MNKKNVITTLFIAFSLNISAFTAEDARALVTRFYSLMTKISSNIYPNHEYTDESFALKNEISSLYFDDEVKMPDELSHCLENSDAPFIRASSYVSKYSKYACDNGPIAFQDIRIISCNPVGVPDFKKKNGESANDGFFCVLVQKKITINDKEYELNDNVSIENASGKIVGIGNRFGGHLYSSEANIKDIDELLLMAAIFYSDKKDYKAAFQTYQKIAELYPNDNECFYRMAAMVYYKQGISDVFKTSKERRQAIRDYLYKARTRGYRSNYGEIREKAYFFYKTWSLGLV